MKGLPPWARHWPRGREAKCGVCGEANPWNIRYYICGFRCDNHKPGANR